MNAIKNKLFYHSSLNLCMMILFSVSVNAMCTPPIGKCDCAYPILEDGHLKCGPTYCPANKSCMENGSCCLTDKVCGSKCCSETQTCADTLMSKCCPNDKPYLNGTECVQCRDDSDCTESGEKCNTETGICENKSCTEIGEIVNFNNQNFCWLNIGPVTNSYAQKRCQEIGMSLPSISDVCLNWNGNTGNTCAGHPLYDNWAHFWTSTKSGIEEDNYGVYNLFYTVSRGNVASDIEDTQREVLCKPNK